MPPAARRAVEELSSPTYGAWRHHFTFHRPSPLSREPVSPGWQPRRVAFLRIASAAAWSFRVARDRRFVRAARHRRVSPSRVPRDRGTASGRRSRRSGEAVSARPVRSARAPRRSSRGRSLVRSPRRARGCPVPAPAERSFEGGLARSTLLLPRPRRLPESRAIEGERATSSFPGRDSESPPLDSTCAVCDNRPFITKERGCVNGLCGNRSAEGAGTSETMRRG